MEQEAEAPQHQGGTSAVESHQPKLRSSTRQLHPVAGDEPVKGGRNSMSSLLRRSMALSMVSGGTGVA